MKIFSIRNQVPTTYQFLISVLLVLLVTSCCFFFQTYIGYRIVALILLMTVSLIAMLFDIFPVLLSSVLSALIWNFFFIPPLFTFHISNPEDVLMFILYFVIALVHSVLTYKIRDAEKTYRDREDKAKEVKLYNTLLNSLSHELRTPIATILGSVDVLIENRSKLNAQQESELLEAIRSAGLRLNRQVGNILDMGRLESGMLKPKTDWCDVSELVNTVMRKMTIPYSQKIIFHSKEFFPLCRVDSGLIEEILHNLLFNAIQYTPPNSIIQIEIEYTNQCLHLKVSDNGNGFPPEEIEHVFDKFYRLPNTATGGSGLGLSIVKGFVEAQNGNITLENLPAGGAVFNIHIPAESTFMNQLKNE